MEFFMTSITVVTLLPILININPVNANSSKPYCNTTRRFYRTSIEEVQHILADAVEELNNTCHEIEVECIPNITIATETDLVMLQDIVNARLEILLGKMKRINGLCETEEQVFYRGEESLNTVCNVLKCKTKSVIAEVIEYLLDHKCGCEEGCHYNPGNFIELTQDVTVTILLQQAYSDVSFLQNITNGIRGIHDYYSTNIQW